MEGGQLVVAVVVVVVVVAAVVAAAVVALAVVGEILGVCKCGRCVLVSFYHVRYPQKCSESSQSRLGVAN